MPGVLNCCLNLNNKVLTWLGGLVLRCSGVCIDGKKRRHGLATLRLLWDVPGLVVSMKVLLGKLPVPPNWEGQISCIEAGGQWGQETTPLLCERCRRHRAKTFQFLSNLTQCFGNALPGGQPKLRTQPHSSVAASK